MKNEEYTENDISLLFSMFSCAHNAVPGISFNKYVDRIIKYVKIDKITFILAVCYIRKITRLYPWLKITKSNRHRLICSAILTAIIHLDDDPVDYFWYARTCGISKNELDNIVMAFIKLIDYKLCYYDNICNEIIKFKKL